MNLNAKDWVLGEDYTQAATCATCHMSANTRNGRKVTHDPGERLSWTNRPPISLAMDTDIHGHVVKPEQQRVQTQNLAALGVQVPSCPPFHPRSPRQRRRP